MTTKKSHTLEELPSDYTDYAEAFTRMQALSRELNLQLNSKKYEEARNTARKIAVDAMMIGIWCRKFIGDKNAD